MITQFDLCDIWRVRNPQTKRYTYRTKKPLYQSILDYWIISNSIQDIITVTDIIPSLYSDHSAIILGAKLLKNDNRGKGYWKFNSSLLKQTDYVENLKMKLTEWRSLYEEFQSKQGLWELIKYEIRKFTINYSPKNKKKERGSEKVLLNTLENLERSFAINPTEEIFTEIQSVKKQLEKIDNDKLNGAIVRSRIKWVEQGEKSSKFFFSMEKNNFVKKHIRKLQTKTGEIITNPKEIAQHQRKYYSELLGPKNIKINNENLKYFLNQKKSQS